MGTCIELLTLIFGLIVIGRTCATIADPVKDEKAMEHLIQSVIKKLCPGSNVCIDNQTTPFVPDESSCCTECSCEEECANIGNCCFKRKELGRESKVMDSECIFPSVPQPLGKNRIYHQSYRMITDVLRYDERGNQKFVKCGDEKVAMWGSLFPVFSQTTKKIYKNMACADAANVTDGQTYAVVLACEHYKDASSLIYELNIETVPDNCEILFKYQKDESDLTSLTCFENLIDTCSGSHFVIPNTLPLSKEDISNACSSGFISPFRQSDMYANVFCHVCNGRTFHAESQWCNKGKGTRAIPEKDFFTILDARLMSSGFHKSVKQANAPIACPSPLNDREFGSCRTVHCPLGQIRNGHGKCVFVMKKLYTQRCSISVKLTANVTFSINDTFDRSVLLSDADVSHLSHAWSNGWFISKVFYEKENDQSDDVTNTLLVQMLNESPISDTNAFLTYVKRALDKPWILKLHDDSLIPMAADFHHNLIISPYRYSEFAKYSTLLGNVTIPLQYFLYRMLEGFKENPFPITQLYFCEQVELNTNEYELYDDLLFNKITNKIHFPGEYTTPTFSKENLRHSARVCIQDSGLRKRYGPYNVNGSNVVSTRAFQKIVFASFIALVQFMLAIFTY